MQKNAIVLTKNRYFSRKLALELAPLGFALTLSDVPRDAWDRSDALLLIDCDTVEMEKYPEGALLFSRRGGEGVISLPLPLGALRSLLEGGTGSELVLNERERTVTVFGRVTRLTAIEYGMLLRLISAGGEVVSKEELRQTLFEGDATPGAVSVYIHYLRQKLELGGEKIILATRGVGYAIAKKFLPREVPVC